MLFNDDVEVITPDWIESLLEYAQQVTAPHVVVIGNAAQALHPIAGQGFNLGLRDAWELAQQVIEQRSQVGEPSMLARYAERRGFTVEPLSRTANIVVVSAALLLRITWAPGVGPHAGRRRYGRRP